MEEIIKCTDEVAHALRNHLPILALESTIIAHGMPYPENLEVARSLEKIARKNGVIPATIAIMNGRICVGLTPEELQHLATASDVQKLSSREISMALVRQKTGATTVAATMFCAHLAGIQVFATGGIGGVHRYAESSWDISADLEELQRTPVIVISAGAKAILDLPKTLEVLETKGVPVYGYQCDDFPAFYSRQSGLPVERVDTAQEIAQRFAMDRKLALSNGILVANPIPETAEIPAERIEKYIDKALQKARQNGITGAKLTPFLLKKIVEYTEGKSLQSNIELVRNNVKIGAEIVREVNQLAH